MMDAMNHPGRPELGTREMPFSRELMIEQDDFMEDAPRKFFRLRPGGEVRLRFGYIIQCDQVIKNEAGEVVELRCSYDPDTRSGTGNSDRKVKGTIHWVSCQQAIGASVRLYDRLFTEANPNSASDFHSVLNPQSLETVDAKLEPALNSLSAGSGRAVRATWLFLPDEKDDSAEARVMNRIVTLRDSWPSLRNRRCSSRAREALIQVL